MAEFQEVMRQIARLCAVTPCSESCPLESECMNLAQVAEPIHAERIEREIMSWAAEHPEPVYPTFYDWIESVMGDDRKLIVDDHDFVNWMVTTRIHADIAQKMGQQPEK